jgi:hypothetical protein
MLSSFLNVLFGSHPPSPPGEGIDAWVRFVIVPSCTESASGTPFDVPVRS